MTGNKGFIKYIVIVVAVIIILSYYGFDIQRTLEAEQTKSNFSYVWKVLSYIWIHFLAGPASWLWQNIVIDIIWHNLSKLKS